MIRALLSKARNPTRLPKTATLRQVRHVHRSQVSRLSEVDQKKKTASDEMHDRLTERRDSQQQTATLPNHSQDSQPSRQMLVKEKAFFRLLNYLPGYEKAVSKIAVPDKFLQISRLFIRGVKLIFQEMKSFSWVYNVLSGTRDPERAAKTMTRRQLEIYDTLPRDLVRVGPVIVLSALPLAQYVVFPVALLFPQKLLSRHFWTEEQKRTVNQEIMAGRHKYYR